MDNPRDIPLRIFSREEIEIFLTGDRREIDRLLLHGLNNVAHILLPYIKREEELHETMGSSEEIRMRVAYIDSLISRQKEKSRMMKKVIDSSILFVIPAFLAFVGWAIWEAILAAIKKG